MNASSYTILSQTVSPYPCNSALKSLKWVNLLSTQLTWAQAFLWQSLQQKACWNTYTTYQQTDNPALAVKSVSDAANGSSTEGNENELQNNDQTHKHHKQWGPVNAFENVDFVVDLSGVKEIEHL